MTKTLEKFILKSRVFCEIPDENGVPICMRHATHLVEVVGKYTLAVCDQCAAYIGKEARINKGRDR